MRTVIKLEHVSKQFSEEQVLKDVCFEFQEGKIYGIVGNNGSGKSILVKTLLGFIMYLWLSESVQWENSCKL